MLLPSFSWMLWNYFEPCPLLSIWMTVFWPASLLQPPWTPVRRLPKALCPSPAWDATVASACFNNWVLPVTARCLQRLSASTVPGPCASLFVVPSRAGLIPELELPLLSPPPKLHFLPRQPLGHAHWSFCSWGFELCRFLLFGASLWWGTRSWGGPPCFLLKSECLESTQGGVRAPLNNAGMAKAAPVVKGCVLLRTETSHYVFSLQ